MPYGVMEIGQHLSKWWLVACSMPSHYMNQCGLIVPQGHDSLQFESKYTHFHSTKYIWKCRLQNGNHCVLASMCQHSSKLCISCRCSTMIDWCVNALMGCVRCARMFHWHSLDVRATSHIQCGICRWNGMAFSHCEQYPRRVAYSLALGRITTPTI